MKEFCQVVIAVLMLVQFVSAVWRDCNGIRGQEPLGFQGVMMSLGIFILMALVFWKAGAFSCFF